MVRTVIYSTDWLSYVELKTPTNITVKMLYQYEGAFENRQSHLKTLDRMRRNAVSPLTIPNPPES